MGNLTLEMSLNKHITRKEELLLDNTLSITEHGIFLCWKKDFTNVTFEHIIMLLCSIDELFNFSFFSTNST